MEGALFEHLRAKKESDMATLLGNNSVVTVDDVDCRVQCPTVTMLPHEWPLWLTVFLYATLFLLSISFLIRSRHQGIFSFKNLFLLLQATAAGLRLIFFIVTIPWTYFWLFLLAIMLPIYSQFLTISLLVVFLWKCIFSINNQTHLVSKYLYPVAGTVIAVLGCVCVVYAYIADERHNRDKANGYDWFLAQLFAIIFGFMTLCLMLVAYYLWKTLKRLAFSSDKQRKVNMAMKIFALYMFLFALRTLWSVLYATHQNLLQSMMNDLQDRDPLTAYYACIFGFYFFFEFFPSACLLIMLFTWLPRGRKSVLLEQDIYGVNTPLLHP
eukprot:m.34715 g.34715  ORF g.34715 m.34715 type:complete len:325 (-) comp9548_c0_seq2:34-1008(-)